MRPVGKNRGGVLVLPGGKPESTATSHPLQLANQRIEWLAHSLRRRLGSGVLVRRVRYRVRRWNCAELDALRRCGDRPRFHARALRRREHCGRRSLDGRASGRAPVCERRRRRGGRLGTTARLTTRTDPHSSYRQTLRARDRGVDANWISIEGGRTLPHSAMAPLA